MCRRGFFSDKRLKENIENIGKTPSGIPIYNYTFKEFMDGIDNIKKGCLYNGVIAQDLLRMGRSDAVYRDDQGFYLVDYDKIDTKFKFVKKL